MSDLEAYAAFARLVELKSFSAVGRDLGISQSKVSKHIAALESEFALPLFMRTTRRVNPTPEAYELFPQVQRLLESAEEVRAVALGHQPEASGLLRIGARDSFARTHLVPIVAAFLEETPRVTVDLILQDRITDMIGEGLDLAIVAEDTLPSGTVVRTLRVYERVVVAAPAYLEAHGLPEAPLDLEDHEVVAPGDWPDGRMKFDSENGPQTVTLTGRFRSNSEALAYEEAVAGRAAAVVPGWLAQSDLRSGRVVQLVPDYYLPPVPLRIAYPQTRLLARRARAFIDFLVATLA